MTHLTPGPSPLPLSLPGRGDRYPPLPLGGEGRVRGARSDPELGGLGPIAAEVAEDAHRHLAPEQVAGDARDVLGGHRLDAGEDLVELESAAEIDLLPRDVAHPAARVLAREHQAFLHVVL